MVPHLGQCMINKWELSLLLIFSFASTTPYMELEKVSFPTLKYVK